MTGSKKQVKGKVVKKINVTHNHHDEKRTKARYLFRNHPNDLSLLTEDYFNSIDSPESSKKPMTERARRRKRRELNLNSNSVLLHNSQKSSMRQRTLSVKPVTFSPSKSNSPVKNNDTQEGRRENDIMEVNDIIPPTQELSTPLSLNLRSKSKEKGRNISKSSNSMASIEYDVINSKDETYSRENIADVKGINRGKNELSNYKEDEESNNITPEQAAKYTDNLNSTIESNDPGSESKVSSTENSVNKRVSLSLRNKSSLDSSIGSKPEKGLKNQDNINSKIESSPEKVIITQNTCSNKYLSPQKDIKIILTKLIDHEKHSSMERVDSSLETSVQNTSTNLNQENEKNEDHLEKSDFAELKGAQEKREATDLVINLSRISRSPVRSQDNRLTPVKSSCLASSHELDNANQMVTRQSGSPKKCATDFDDGSEIYTLNRGSDCLNYASKDNVVASQVDENIDDELNSLVEKVKKVIQEPVVTEDDSDFSIKVREINVITNRNEQVSCNETDSSSQVEMDKTKECDNIIRNKTSESGKREILTPKKSNEKLDLGSVSPNEVKDGQRTLTRSESSKINTKRSLKIEKFNEISPKIRKRNNSNESADSSSTSDENSDNDSRTLFKNSHIKHQTSESENSPQKNRVKRFRKRRKTEEGKDSGVQSETDESVTKIDCRLRESNPLDNSYNKGDKVVQNETTQSDCFHNQSTEDTKKLLPTDDSGSSSESESNIVKECPNPTENDSIKQNIDHNQSSSINASISDHFDRSPSYSVLSDRESVGQNGSIEGEMAQVNQSDDDSEPENSVVLSDCPKDSSPQKFSQIQIDCSNSKKRSLQKSGNSCNDKSLEKIPEESNTEILEVEKISSRNMNDLSPPKNNSTVKKMSKSPSNKEENSESDDLDLSKLTQAEPNYSSSESSDSEKDDTSRMVKIGEYNVNVSELVAKTFKSFTPPTDVLKNVQKVEAKLLLKAPEMYKNFEKHDGSELPSDNKIISKSMEKRWFEFCKQFGFDRRKPKYFFKNLMTDRFFSRNFRKYFISFIGQDQPSSISERTLFRNFELMFKDKEVTDPYTEYEKAVILALEEKLSGKDLKKYVNFVAAYVLNRNYYSVQGKRLKLVRESKGPVKLERQTKSNMKRPRISKSNISDSKNEQTHNANVHIDVNLENVEKKMKASSLEQIENGGNLAMSPFKSPPKSNKSNTDSEGESEGASNRIISKNSCYEVQDDHRLRDVRERFEMLQEKSEDWVKMLDQMLEISGQSRTSIENLRHEELAVRDWRHISVELSIPAHTAKAVYESKIHPLMFSSRPINKYELILDMLSFLQESGYKSWRDVDWLEMSQKFDSLKPLFLFTTFIDFAKVFVPFEQQENFTDCIDCLLRKRSDIEEMVNKRVILDICV